MQCCKRMKGIFLPRVLVPTSQVLIYWLSMAHVVLIVVHLFQFQ